MPVIVWKAGERKHKHLIAEQYLAEHPGLGRGTFLILVGKAPAAVWKVSRSSLGGIRNLEQQRPTLTGWPSSQIPCPVPGSRGGWAS